MSGHLEIVQREEDGLWSIGFHDDAAGPFESRQFAVQVASGHQPAPAPPVKFRRIQIREVNRDASS